MYMQKQKGYTGKRVTYQRARRSPNAALELHLKHRAAGTKGGRV